MCWYVISITCIMTCEQLVSWTQKLMKYDACKCQVNIELYCNYICDNVSWMQSTKQASDLVVEEDSHDGTD